MEKIKIVNDILEIAIAYNYSKVLLTANNLNLFTFLEKAKSIEEIKEGLKLNGRQLDDFLDILVSLNLLEIVSGLYKNTPLSSLVLSKKSKFSISDFLSISNRNYKIWGG